MSPATAARTAATGAAFPVRICVHRPASPTAIRVASRRPGPARLSASGGTDSGASCAAMAAATTCGACEISATQRSWVSASVTTGSAPHAVTSAVTVAAVSARGLGSRAQRPGPAEEEVRPGCGLPGPFPAGQRMSGHVAGDVAAGLPGPGQGQRLHAGDVRVAVRQARALRCGQDSGHVGGRHRDQRHVGGPAGLPGPRASRRPGLPGLPDWPEPVRAPRSAASAAAAGSRSQSQTSTPWRRRASAADVPIKPVPMTTTCLGTGAWVTARCPAGGPPRRAGTRAGSQRGSGRSPRAS